MPAFKKVFEDVLLILERGRFGKIGTTVKGKTNEAILFVTHVQQMKLLSLRH